MKLIATFLDANSISTPALAEASGVSPRTIGAIRAGRANPTLRTMKQVALGCSSLTGRRVEVRDLFDLSVKRSPK
jgi:transcriptional regulator with XRE-family HTH domain